LGRQWIFFLAEFAKAAPIIQFQHGMEVGNGRLVSFWYDPWNGAPLRGIRDGLPRPLLQKISLCDAAPIINDLRPLQPIQHVFSDTRDRLKWRWTNTGLYTASSFYKTMMYGGRIRCRFHEIWTSRTPSKVRIFTVLLLQDKLLTHEVMVRRSINCERRCVMCDTCELETAVHLILSCSYAERVWRYLDTQLGFKIMVPRETMGDTWDGSKRSRPRAVGKISWTSRFMCALWMLWKQRNEKIFRNKRTPPALLADKILQEGNLWMRYCGGSAPQTGIG